MFFCLAEALSCVILWHNTLLHHLWNRKVYDWTENSCYVGRKEMAACQRMFLVCVQSDKLIAIVHLATSVCICICAFASVCICMCLHAFAFDVITCICVCACICVCVSTCVCIHLRSSAYRTNVQTCSDANGSLHVDASLFKDFQDVL